MSTKAPAEVDAGAGAVVVHVTRIEPRPLAVSEDETSQREFGWKHRRRIYRALGVPIAELPNGRFAVLVADVEAALRARAASKPAPRATSPEASDDDALLARAGLRRVAGGRR
ncbi:MAG: hypothetical protein U0271_34165 [Polyangiaceae bacterium]